MENHVTLSVRQLVSYVCQSGSIDAKFRTATTMTEGTKAHQRVQKTYKAGDQKEVPLKLEVAYEELIFNIEGRCDGILLENEVVVIDEIKSTTRSLDEIHEDTYPEHWAQAKCYAYMYASDHQKEEMVVQIRYINLDEDEQKLFRETWSIVDLEDFIRNTLDTFAPFARMRIQHLSERNQSIQALPFPFQAYRAGQRQLAGSVYKTISEGGTLFANAPTGIGKTMSTAYPTVKAIGEGLIDRFFYLTAKTITRTAAEDAFSLMRDQGLKLNTVTLTAKDKVCFKEKTICEKAYCEFANGYYDRLNVGLLDLFNHETVMDRTTIEAYARKHTLCPFEFSLDAAYQADAVICDYNYIFDPRVSLKRFFDDQQKHTTLLIDEAHNLVDRAREMFSATLGQTPFYKLEKMLQTQKPSLYQACREVNDYFLASKKRVEKEGTVLKELPEGLLEKLERFVEEAEQELLHSVGEGHHEGLLDVYFASQQFMRLSKFYDHRYVTLMSYVNGELHLSMYCLDPSFNLQQMGKDYHSKVFFSATLMPFQYYLDMLGKEEGDYSLTLPSPFPKENVQVETVPLSTRFKDRERTRDSIVSLIKKTIAAHPGNYLVFTPSYQYMNDLYDAFYRVKETCETMLQDPNMTEDERERFLERFQPRTTGSFVGFSILGGLFSEGIDLKGDRLNGVIVVGVGLPQIGLERDVIKSYFDEIGKNGYDYAYIYPGINKVLQAGGRLIRSETDTGVIVLIDDRFLTPKYQRLLPLEWR